MARLNGFLTGVRILDLSQYLPGPFASLLLADMGADVLKIVPPQGDGMRHLGPRGADGGPLFYRAVNAGKRVLDLDLKSAEGRAEFLELARDADVLIESFRPGVLERLGVAPALLREHNPGLILCSLSGYGANSALGEAAGHDGNFLALAGVLHRNADGIFDPPLADMSGALFAVSAILGALHARARDGAGCSIDLALADAAMPLQLFHVAALGALGTVPQPRGTYLNGGAAYYRDYRTSDGRIVLGAVEPKFWQNFCRAAGRPDWIARQGDAIPQDALIGELEAFFGALSRDACAAMFAGADCCLSPVLDLGEAVASGQVAARELVRPATAGDLQCLFPARVNGEAPEARPPLRDAEAGRGWLP